ncbi:MAG: T9SS type A sorting domain-containing protein [Taibaiella sp.]|nr:T9SS type A sorting domain-containing protein [Taibaiella sp.]
MKIRAIIVAGFLLLISALLSSYHTGLKGSAYRGSAINGCDHRTGCHTTSSPSLSCITFLQDSTGGISQSFLPGGKYILNIRGVYSHTLIEEPNSLSYFGFALGVFGWRDSFTHSTSNGIFDFASASSHSIDTFAISNGVIIEQTDNIPSSTANSFQFSIPWTAPIGTDTILLTGNMCATNGNRILDSEVCTRSQRTILYRANVATPIIPNLLSVSIFPNPFVNTLVLTFNSIIQPYINVEIFNMAGKMIFKLSNQSNIIVNTASWQAGMYYVCITQGNSAQTFPVIRL